MSLLTLSMGLLSCEPQKCTGCPEEGLPATLTLTLSQSATKSTVAPADAEDNRINTIDVFIFNAPEEGTPGYGQLDTYGRFEENLEQIEIQTTTGPKKICVIVNAKAGMTDGVTSLGQLRAVVAGLKDETFGNLTMYGETDSDLDINSSVSVSVSRFISRIAITSVKTRFAGTPYEGSTLSNCRIYLINAHADTRLDGQASQSPAILNKGALSATDMEGLSQEALMLDDLTSTVNDAGYTAAHYLYCYPNETDDPDNCTMAVLQADLNGSTYYYPIPVNQEGYGYIEDNGHYGIRGNTVYSYSITVTRPGSTDPDAPIDTQALAVTVNVEDWDVIPEFNKIF